MNFGFLNLPVFLAALILGLIYNYVNKPAVNVITRYPTVYNANKITYLDDVGVCYKYDVEEVPCPNDADKIVEFPIQQDTPTIVA